MGDKKLYAKKICRKSPDPPPQNVFGVVFFIVLTVCKFSEQSEHILIFGNPNFFFFKEKVQSLCKHMIFHSELFHEFRESIVIAQCNVFAESFRPYSVGLAYICKYMLVQNRFGRKNLKKPIYASP